MDRVVTYVYGAVILGSVLLGRTAQPLATGGWWRRSAPFVFAASCAVFVAGFVATMFDPTGALYLIGMTVMLASFLGARWCIRRFGRAAPRPRRGETTAPSRRLNRGRPTDGAHG